MLKKTPMQELIQIPNSRFLWWICKEFKVLPTESRFDSLTEEQLDWMYYNYQQDIKDNKRSSGNYSDDEDVEYYQDPDFDNYLEEYENSDDFNSHPSPSYTSSEEGEKDLSENLYKEDDVDINNPDLWEEV